eukprot:snap_masked-scaffold_9-processed-gene-13.45-mRNA-1 protein AED:0.89 eAED:0.89 QI:0/0/0/0.5/1/1/2/0/405
MPSRNGRTPNELFLYFRPATDAFLRDLEHFAVIVEQDLKEPSSIADIETAIKEIQKELERTQSQAYEVARLKREAENSRRNKKAGVVIQYSPGDYVLVSEKGTPFASEKTRLSWIGPYQVLEVVSNNVYRLEALTGKIRIVHGSRMWFYSHQMPIGNKKLKSLFIHNYQSLEVDKIMDIKFSEGNNPIYLLKIRWLGFDPDSDTWEPLISIYQDLPILVRKYIEDELLDESFKKHLLLVLEKAEKKEYDPLKKSKTSRVRRINAIHNVEKVEKSNTLGWFQEEKRILEQLVHKFGSGKYEDYENKSKQQLSTQLQRLMNLQSIGLFHGLRFEPAKGKEFLTNKFGIVEFHRNIPGRFNLAAERGFLLDLFQKEMVTDVPAEDININYFRRLDDPQHLQLILEEFE